MTVSRLPEGTCVHKTRRNARLRKKTEAAKTSKNLISNKNKDKADVVFPQNKSKIIRAEFQTIILNSVFFLRFYIYIYSLKCLDQADIHIGKGLSDTCVCVGEGENNYVYGLVNV